MNMQERLNTIAGQLTANKMPITKDNIITQSLFSAGGTLTNNDGVYIDRFIRSIELDEAIRRKFIHLSNTQLVARINGLPDFKWDDEGHELSRRIKASNGKFAAQMQYNTIVILKDEK